MQEKLDMAETFLERVTAQENENVIAWTLYAMLYELKGLDMNAEITLKKCLRLNQAQYAEQLAALTHQHSTSGGPNDSSHAEEGADLHAKKEEGKSCLFFQF